MLTIDIFFFFGKEIKFIMHSWRSSPGMICRTPPKGIPTKNLPYLLIPLRNHVCITSRLTPFLAYDLAVLSLSACVQALLYFHSDFFLLRTCYANCFTAFQLSLLFVTFSRTFVELMKPISASSRWRLSAQWQQLKKVCSASSNVSFSS